MTHDTYDTCFYKLITRAQERRKKNIYYIYKKQNIKVSKTGVTGVMCHRNGIGRMWGVLLTKTILLHDFCK